eukprot:5373323-Amphidinium_carterae.1
MSSPGGQWLRPCGLKPSIISQALKGKGFCPKGDAGPYPSLCKNGEVAAARRADCNTQTATHTESPCKGRATAL